MFLFLYPEMLDVHVCDKKALDKIASDFDYRLAFDNLLIGVNIVSTSYINDIAVYITSLSKEDLLKVTLSDVVKAVGNYEDTSGRLV